MADTSLAAEVSWCTSGGGITEAHGGCFADSCVLLVASCPRDAPVVSGRIWLLQSPCAFFGVFTIDISATLAKSKNDGEPCIALHVCVLVFVGCTRANAQHTCLCLSYS